MEGEQSINLKIHWKLKLVKPKHRKTREGFTIWFNPLRSTLAQFKVLIHEIFEEYYRIHSAYPTRVNGVLSQVCCGIKENTGELSNKIIHAVHNEADGNIKQQWSLF